MLQLCPMIAAAVTLGTQSVPSLEDLSWLTGRWTGSHEGTQTEEVWTHPAGGVMLGMHRDVMARDRFFHEFLMIRESADGIQYVASPRGGPSTVFRLSAGGATHAVFTNPDHDFPQRIEYRLTPDDELHVTVSGESGATQSWIWRRSGWPQQRNDERTVDTAYVILPREREIALARSAAPASVSAQATVWIIQDGEYQIAIEGTNGNHCAVARTYPMSMEPVCYDEEGSRTILPIEIRRFQLRRSGHGPDEIDARVRTEIGAGDLRVPRRPAMSYMMSSAQVLYGEDGQPAGNWRPHLMLYMPYVTMEEFGAPEDIMGAMMVANPGEPTAFLMVVLPEFVDPVFDP